MKDYIEEVEKTIEKNLSNDPHFYDPDAPQSQSSSVLSSVPPTTNVQVTAVEKFLGMPMVSGSGIRFTGPLPGDVLLSDQCPGCGHDSKEHQSLHWPQQDTQYCNLCHHNCDWRPFNFGHEFIS